MTSQDEKLAAGHVAVPRNPRWWALPAIFALLATVVGCGTQSAPDAGSHTVALAAADDVWEAFYLQGGKIGYGHTTSRPVERDGRKLLETRSTNDLTITRFGERTQQQVDMELLETSDGEVLEFETKVDFGPTPTRVTGRAEGDQMVITTETQGRRQTARIPWSRDVRGFRGIEQSLARNPMSPGEHRSFKMLMPLVNQIAEADLTAQDYEMTQLLGIEARLLRVNVVARLPGGQSIKSTFWTDSRGEVIKTRVAAIGQESFRTSRELAQSPAGDQDALDLGLDMIVKVDPPLEKPYQTHQVRYRVELDDGDPAKAFATGPTQSLRALTPGAAEVTVRSLKPSDLEKPAEPPPAVAPEYTAGGSVLQIDDPRVREMAQEAKGDATDPVDVAIALEKYVNRIVSEKNFSQGFATAAEVAESREGDCTEHAVLLAALARACGIPSRVAIGLVYVERAGGFGYHMWTEVYLHGKWVPLDAIMAQGGTSAAYLKLADSSLDGANAYSSFLAVAEVLGQLKVSVLEAE